MIFSMSSDLKTKQIVWTMRMNNGNSMPYALSAFAYAGGFAKTFKDEAKPVSIDWCATINAVQPNHTNDLQNCPIRISELLHTCSDG